MKSFNNEIGLPLAVLLVERDTRYLVLEMGARHAGHIAYLTGIVPPRVGLVINVGTAHVGEFGSRQAIADAKSELVQALPAAAEGGIAVLNADDELVMGMTAATKAKVLTFGRTEAADVQFRDVELDEAGRPRFTLAYGGAVSEVHMTLHGEHNVANASAAAAVALGLGADLEQVAAALSRAVHVSAGRMQVLDRGDGVTIVNDAFNSSPDAAVLSLNALAAMRAGRRTVAVLGEMRELGPDTDEGHARVGAAAAETGVDLLIAVGGPDADTLARAALERRPDVEVVRAADRDEALAAARGALQPGDLCLVKGSHAVGLEHTAMLLARPDDVTATA
jgi:UDP-N-acetylmuramoyl-tripeptide--D-alanyl-D-alanine ligase